MKKRNKVLKEAVVLLIAVAMLFSTVTVTADTNDDTKPVLIHEKSPTFIEKVNPQNLRGTVVWDNGMNYDNACAAQWDPNFPLDAFPADDFHFEEDTEVCDVHWVAMFDPDAIMYPWCIQFWFDDGTGTAPGQLWQEHCFAGEEIEKVDLGSGYYEMSVDLPYNKLFEGCHKYWICIFSIGPIPPQTFWGMHTNPITLHQAVFMSQYFGFPHWTDSEVVFGNPYDMCFQLTQKCEPSIDVEKYVWDPEGGVWVDADTPEDALDLEICTDVSFKIVIFNDGECPLVNIIVKDWMHDSLEFISADPEPDNFQYTPPEYFMEWFFPGPVYPGDVIEIYITAHVEGPDCSRDYNRVIVEGFAEDAGEFVTDQDEAWVHAIEKSRIIKTPFLNWLKNHPNMFPMLRLLLQRFGL